MGAMANSTNFIPENSTSHSAKCSNTIFQNFVITGIPVMTIAANIPAVILVFWITIRKKNTKNLHLLSIGITDFFVGLFAYLLSEVCTQATRQFSFYDCVFRYYMYSVTFVASLLHVLGVCVQRLNILLSDIKNQQNHKIVEWTVIIVSWILSAIFNTVAFVVWIDEHEIKTCSIDDLVLGHEHSFFTFVGNLYAIIIILVMVAMGILIRVICLKTNKFPGQSWRQRDIKLCTTIGIMALLFFVSTTPLTCVLLIYEFLGSNMRIKRSICLLISLLNSSINPIVYLFRVKEFRNAFTSLLNCNKNNAIKPSKVVTVNHLDQAPYQGPSTEPQLTHVGTLRQIINLEPQNQQTNNQERKGHRTKFPRLSTTK